jgi:putative transposase
MITYKRHRFPPDIISYAVWLYYRLNLSHRDIKDLLAERGIRVSRETIRLWCIKFGAIYARRLKRKHRGYGETFYLDEVFVKINGKQHYLWRAVDQDGDVIDILVRSRRIKDTARRFFKKLLKGQASTPLGVVTDKLRSCQAALRKVAPSILHITDPYENNRTEVSHQSRRQQERQMGRFKSPRQAQRFLSFHGPINNLFRQQRHLLSARHYRFLRDRAFETWEQATRIY